MQHVLEDNFAMAKSAISVSAPSWLEDQQETGTSTELTASMESSGESEPQVVSSLSHL